MKKKENEKKNRDSMVDLVMSSGKKKKEKFSEREREIHG